MHPGQPVECVRSLRDQAMSDYTRLGCGIWDWDPFIDLDLASRNLWLALYTSPESKRMCPGLWHGSIIAMADASKMQPDATLKALDHLLEVEMVEYDQKHRVLRLVQLPDAGEYPNNTFILGAWWKRFLNVPQCQVRDAHVPTIRWILERGASMAEKNKAKTVTPGHEQVWIETFGTVTIPPPRRRGLRRLVDADTSTPSQPSLFGEPPSETLHQPSATPSPALPLPSPVSDPQIKEFRDLRVPETLFRGSGEGEGEGEGGSSFLLPESGEQAACQPRPRLTLVPPAPSAMCTPLELVNAIACGAPALVPEDHTDAYAALSRTIGELEREGMRLADVAQAAPWAKPGWQQVRGDPRYKPAVWAGTPGILLDAIEQARKHEYAAAQKLADVAEARRALGHTTT